MGTETLVMLHLTRSLQEVYKKSTRNLQESQTVETWMQNSCTKWLIKGWNKVNPLK